jgi:hypothetical protein
MQGNVKVPHEATPAKAVANILQRVGAVALFSLVAGFMLPGGAAFLTGVFFHDNMVPIVTKAIINIEEEKVLINNDKEIHRSEDQIRVNFGLENENNTVTLMTSDAGCKVSTTDYPISIQPFYLHLISVLRFFECLCLGICVFIPPFCAAGRKWWIEMSRLIVYLDLSLWSINAVALVFRVYARSTVEDGRTVFAYTNPDISLPSFVVQNIQFVISFAFIAIIWLQWLSYAYTRYIEVTNEKHGRIDRFVIEILSFTMLHWQCICALVSASFIFYTILEWWQVITNNDYRFVYETIIFHLIWVITIAIVTAPLVITRIYCGLTKSQLLLQLNKVDLSAEDRAGRFAVTQELNPVSPLNAPVSGAGVLLSLVLPIILPKLAHI